MLLVLDDREIDVTHRAVVVDAGGPAPRLTSDGAAVRPVGPFDVDPPSRIAMVVGAIVGGERVIVSNDVPSDRRVAEVVARILEARSMS